MLKNILKSMKNFSKIFWVKYDKFIDWKSENSVKIKLIPPIIFISMMIFTFTIAWVLPHSIDFDQTAYNETKKFEKSGEELQLIKSEYSPNDKSLLAIFSSGDSNKKFSSKDISELTYIIKAEDVNKTKNSKSEVIDLGNGDFVLWVTNLNKGFKGLTFNINSEKIQDSEINTDDITIKKDKERTNNNSKEKENFVNFYLSENEKYQVKNLSSSSINNIIKKYYSDERKRLNGKLKKSKEDVKLLNENIKDSEDSISKEKESQQYETETEKKDSLSKISSYESKIQNINSKIDELSINRSEINKKISLLKSQEKDKLSHKLITKPVEIIE